MGLCIRNRAVAWRHGLGNWFHREVYLMTKTQTHSSTDSEAFRDALEQLAAVACTAVSYVGYANYSERQREAQSWIRKKHEELLAAPRVPPQAAWQPVDTAPHEARVLLGWYQPDGTWFCETGMASHGWRRNGISNMSRHGVATHWQPLPSPLSRPEPQGAPEKPPVKLTTACERCEGDGYVRRDANLPDVKCPDCNGWGYSLTRPQINTGEAS